MSGKKGRSGRPRGSISRYRNPVHEAASCFRVLCEAWLAGVPIAALPPPQDRVYTVPPKIKRVLCAMAIARTKAVVGAGGRPIKRIDSAAVLAADRRHAPAVTLRRQKRTPADPRAVAYADYVRWLQDAWQTGDTRLEKTRQEK